MKKWMFMLLALLAFTVLPSSGTELGELHPVSLLVVRTQGRNIQLLTDTVDVGAGETLDAALQNLEDTTPGHLFLDTVENLILTEETIYLIPQLKQLLRPSVTVCVTESELNSETAPEYLHTHTPKQKLSDADESTPLQKLTYSEERYFLEG